MKHSWPALIRWILAKPKRWGALIVLVGVFVLAIRVAGPSLCDIFDSMSSM